jgi:hypothetical protein
VAGGLEDESGEGPGTRERGERWEWY